MEDSELERIRQKRMAELQQQRPSAGMAGMPGLPGMPPQQQGEDAEKQRQAQDMRRNMLASLLDNEARERLNRISIVKPEKTKAVEDLIIRMAQTGRIQKRLTEDDVVQLLTDLSANQAKPSVVIQRRRDADLSSDEEYNF